MLEITRLEKTYPSPDGSSVTALFLEKFTLSSGRQTAVAGPSGAGKSTLLSILGGILAPTSGTILWNGKPWPDKDAAVSARERAQRIGFIFQELNLLPSLTLFENLAVAARFLGMNKDEETIRAALERVGLSARAGHRPDQLSRGEQQRAAVARAMLHPHDLILADEPTASLDEANGSLVMELLIDAARRGGSALLVATHDPMVMDMLPDTFRLARHSETTGRKNGEPAA